MDQHRFRLRHSLHLFSFLLISIIPPTDLATERCPNCLDGECKGSGECTKGCIVGFADKYCQHKCQSTCKDANCQLDEDTGKMICLSGCEDGYCRQQCKAPCVDGCLKCDNRTCTCETEIQPVTSIPPTDLATERCPNCLDGECQGSGQCTKGCIVGFADKYCRHKCQPGCKDANCQLDENTGKMICLSGCEDGFCRQQCKAPCVDGCLKCDNRTCTCSRCNESFDGDECQHSCLDGCLVCDNKGQCLSCKDGLHGRNCEHKCSSTCIRCKQDTGKCITCQQGFHGESCDQALIEETIEIQPDASNSNPGKVVVIVVVIVIFIATFKYATVTGRCKANERCRRWISNANERCRRWISNGISQNRRSEKGPVRFSDLMVRESFLDTMRLSDLVKKESLSDQRQLDERL